MLLRPRSTLDTGATKAKVSTRRRWSTLALVVRTQAFTAVGVLGGRGQVEEAELTDLHARVEQDRHGRSIRQFQGDVAREAGINEASG